MIISSNEGDELVDIEDTFKYVDETPVVLLPNDVVPHDIFSHEYWNQLHTLGRRVNPLRQKERKDHAREFIGTIDHGVPRTRALTELRERPMNTGIWDPNRQYLPDGSISLEYW